MTQARKQTAYSALATDADVIVLLDQWQLRHFDKENSRIAEGCTSYSWQYKAAAAENGVRRFLVTSTQAANILVGSTVFVGDPGSNSNLDPRPKLHAQPGRSRAGAEHRDGAGR